MEINSFSNFSFSVNATSKKAGYKEVFVSFTYNDKEVIRIVYINDIPGTDYVSEAKKIIDKEMSNGKLASYSRRFIKRNKRKSSDKYTNWLRVSMGFAIASLIFAGTSMGLYYGKGFVPQPGPDPEPVTPTFNVTYVVDGCKVVTGPDTIDYGTSLYCEVQLDNYKTTNIPQPYITMSGTFGLLSPGSGDNQYTWENLGEGKYSCLIPKVTGDLSLYFMARDLDPDSYYIIWNDDESCKITKIDSDDEPESTIGAGENFECYIKAVDSANYVSQIVFISMNGKTLSQPSDYTFNNSHLIIPKVSGDILLVYGSLKDDHIGELKVDFDEATRTAKVTGIWDNPENGLSKDKIEKITVDSYITNPLDGLDYEVTEIAYGAFNGCSNLKELTLPFVGGHKDQQQHEGDANKHPWLFGYIFGSTFFSGCGMITWQDFYDTDLIDEEDTDHHIMEPASIPISLESVTITDKVALRRGAFSQCKYIQNIVLQNPVKNNEADTINGFAFYGCAGLKNISISTNNSIKIMSRAFQNCTSLKTFDLNAVTHIDHHAFNNCSSISSLYLPDCVKYVGPGAFYGLYNSLIVCEKTKEETSDWDPDWVDEESPVIYNSPTKPTDYVDNQWHFYLVDDGATNKLCAFIIEYLGAATGDEAETIIIPRTVTAKGQSYDVCHIGTYTFIDYIFTKKFIFESDVNTPHPILTIGHYAFENCKALETIEGLNNSNLKSVGSYAFASCEKLSIIDTISKDVPPDPEIFPITLEEIGNYSFYNCSKIQSLDVPGVKRIGDSAFEGCSYHVLNKHTGEWEYSMKDGEMLTDLRINNEAESFGTGTFAYCCGLKKIHHQGEFKMTAYINVPDYCFAYTNLAEIGFPESTVSIGMYSFAYCSATDLILTDAKSLESIGDGAFFGCAALNCDITLPSTLTNIGQSAFEECTKLKSLNLGACSSIKDIPYALCYNCVYMTSFTFPSAVETIGAYTFGGCMSFTTINGSSSTPTLPTTLKKIGDRAFMDCVSFEVFYINNANGYLGEGSVGVNIFAGWNSGEGIWVTSQKVYLKGNCFVGGYDPDDYGAQTTWGWKLDYYWPVIASHYYLTNDCGAPSLRFQSY